MFAVIFLTLGLKDEGMFIQGHLEFHETENKTRNHLAVVQILINALAVVLLTAGALKVSSPT